VFSAQVEVSDELELIPTFAIALSGCDLRCDFCITGRESWNSGAGRALDVPAVLAAARTALADGARTVMILGGEPTIHLPAALEIVAGLPDDTKLVWKTNGHEGLQAHELLDGLFDVWVVDHKFGNDACARQLAKVDNYSRALRRNLGWARARTDLIVRHLLMPGHVECCWRPVAGWLAAALPGVKVNLRAGFWPAWFAARHTELRGTVDRAERELAWTIARKHRLNLVP
jgi:putative pyruvate formate lyase activating enzyme